MLILNPNNYGKKLILAKTLKLYFIFEEYNKYIIIINLLNIEFDIYSMKNNNWFRVMEHIKLF